MTKPARKYDWQHQQARRAALAAMQDGDLCSRCHRPMLRKDAKLLDLDHTDDRTSYRGLAHRHCNRSAGAARREQLRRERQTPPTPRRPWHARQW